MRNRHFVILDAFTTAVAIIVAFAARFEGWAWWAQFGSVAAWYAVVAIPAKAVVFHSLGLYRRLWKYASIGDLELLVAGALAGMVVSYVTGIIILPVAHLTATRVPIGVLLMESLITAGGVSLSRLGMRMSGRRRRFVRRQRGPSDARRRVLIAGAGDAGGMVAKELLENDQLHLLPIGFVDDDGLKHGHHLHGIRVLGAISDIETLVGEHAIDEVVIALPKARGKVIRDIMRRSAAAGARNRIVPGLFELLSGAKAVSSLRPVQIEDLLRREPIDTNLDEVRTLATERTVLITGAGGSIGSELCRQIARLQPNQIIALGRGENSIFELLQELRITFPDVPVRPAIVDVRDRVRLRAVFDRYRPYTVFHAAAHKHVPLMESSVDEAILNNVLGTRNVVELCGEYNVEHFVLVSTDKAVRPTSIMGATKRIAEGTLCSIVERTKRPYVSVRFGNVLGSRGSVVPTFLKQIAAGGPLTITHPEMRRYFMTIPEAVQLVLQAGAMGRGGEVFVLDMGESVRISDLAEDLIRLSGLELGSDIDICYTGIRPGEKLYEELFFGPDDATPTSHPKILQARDSNSSAELDVYVDRLIEAARTLAPEAELRRMIQVLVPEYQGNQPPAESPPTGIPIVSLKHNQEATPASPVRHSDPRLPRHSTGSVRVRESQG